MDPRKPLVFKLVTTAFFTLFSSALLWPETDSHARIVRLSFVEGEVTVQRPDVQTWSEAPVNTPIEEGFRLSTGANSFAEVQFENGGTVRVGQLALLEFTKLGLAPDGSKINELQLRQGYATFHPLASGAGESLQVDTPYATLNAGAGDEFRVDLDQGVERIEVFQGEVEEQSSLGATTIRKDSVVVLQPGASQPVSTSQGITQDDWDQWVKSRDSQMEMGGPSPEDYSDNGDESAYGWSDLMQYGYWSDVPGVGYGWAPNLVGADWAPYSMGQWCWYAGYGYTWIGAEPWGWLPYHYGGWEFVPGMGWMWFPNSLNSWSPAGVTWYRGPGWVGWTPRPHRKDGATDCQNNCGGGVVSTTTFRQGGMLSSNLMLAVSPVSGTKVHQPGILPTTAIKLPGQAVQSAAAQNKAVVGEAARTRMGITVTAPTRPATIIYDSQQHAYVNVPDASAASSSSLRVSPAQPGPVRSFQGFRQTSPAGSPTTQLPAATAPRGNTAVFAAPPRQDNPGTNRGSFRPSSAPPEGHVGGGMPVSGGGGGHAPAVGGGRR